MSHSQFFNSHHSPIGAFASFTLGSKGARGGLGLELAGPADQSVYIGVEERDRPGQYRALPFFHAADSGSSQQENFDVEGLSDFHHEAALIAFVDSEITRSFGAASDSWTAGDLTFRLTSKVGAAPDPDTAVAADLQSALVPAVVAELTVDNRLGSVARKAFFGYAGSDSNANMRVWREQGLTGIGQGTTTAIATDAEGVRAGTAWQPEAILNIKHEENLPFMLGNLGLLVGTVPAGEVRTFKFAICFFREGTATTGVHARYMYRKWFETIEDVARFALQQVDQAVREGAEFERRLTAGLSSTRAKMLCQATRSYYGCTQCLERTDGRALWVVHEGEYRMMNTFDLTVDQAFFELALNPWTVRNTLDLYVERYSYTDNVCFPGDPRQHCGGIAFTHDMGVANAFSEPGRSGYEQAGLRGCFSYMTCEELVNWALTACLYVSHTSDFDWARRNADTFKSIVASLTHRDHPDQNRRNGVMGLDSSRCAGGSEITTYDSLDASLGQARNNVYLAVKCWAAYVLLEPLLTKIGETESASTASDQAALCASTLVAAVGQQGCLPAVLSENVPARIIPAIEGLIYPYAAGRNDLIAPDGPYGDLRVALEHHFDFVLNSGGCRFNDGGWRLSSTSRNSWLSKIYLCQSVAEKIFGFEPDAEADAAHLNWLMDEQNSYYAFCDQMLEGKAVGSRYYPRGVTSVLWSSPIGSLPIDHLAARFGGSSEDITSRA